MSATSGEQLEMSFDPASPLLGVYPFKMRHVEEDPFKRLVEASHKLEIT